MSESEHWPADADGDVFRRLRRDGFDFERGHMIEFNIDFADWPPPTRAVELIRDKYPDAKVYQPEYESPGYLQVPLCTKLTYREVVGIQNEISKMVAPFEGSCDSWGVLRGNV